MRLSVSFLEVISKKLAHPGKPQPPFQGLSLLQMPSLAPIKHVHNIVLVMGSYTKMPAQHLVGPRQISQFWPGYQFSKIA